MNKIIYLAVFFLLTLFFSGCSDKDEEGEPISGLEVKVYADIMDAIHNTDGTDERNYAYWDASPYDENIQTVIIHLDLKFVILHNLPDDIESWFEDDSPVTVRIDGVLKPTSINYYSNDLTKPFDFFVSRIYRLDNK